MKLCSMCGQRPRLPYNHSWCRLCRNAHSRANRPRHRDLPEDQRRKANARSYANTYQRRGKLKPKPCARCGSRKVEKHHEDHSKPLQVTWFCREHHEQREAELLHERLMGRVEENHPLE